MNEIGYVGWLERNFLFVFLLLFFFRWVIHVTKIDSFSQKTQNWVGGMHLRIYFFG